MVRIESFDFSRITKSLNCQTVSCCGVMSYSRVKLTSFYENVPFALIVIGLYLQTGGPSCHNEKGLLVTGFQSHKSCH